MNVLAKLQCLLLLLQHSVFNISCIFSNGDRVTIFPIFPLGLGFGRFTFESIKHTVGVYGILKELFVQLSVVHTHFY